MRKQKRSYHRKYRKHSRKNNRTHKTHIRKHNRTNRKYKILTIPGSQGVPIFSIPERHVMKKNVINQGNTSAGNIIPGLRNL